MRLYLLFAAVLGLREAQATSFTSLKLFATPLPAHFSELEPVKGLELRLFLDKSSSDAVRVTPTSAGVIFQPTFVVFNSTVSIIGDITAKAKTSGDFTITYVATLEGSQTGSAILYSQSVTVFPVPTAYRVEANEWKGVVLQSDSFENSAETPLTSSFWSEQQHGYSSNACGGVDGTNSLFFTSLGDRLALTAPLKLQGLHGKMHFNHLYGFETVQKYDSQGDNRVACEMTDIGEEVLFGYLPSTADPRYRNTWKEILEIPLPITRSKDFLAYSVVLPSVSMHQNAQFYWMQKNHSSFPIDVKTGLTRAALTAAENDPTAVRGQLGDKEREFWKYRNLFDQWAIDNVQLEVRLNVPVFSKLNSVGIGGNTIEIESSVPESWVEYTSGDGTQAFPVCKPSAPSDASPKATVTLDKSGYVHAIACLLANNLLVSSYPVRSARIFVQASEPSFTSLLDASGSVDTWTLDLKCPDCESFRYIIVPLAEEGSSFMPSCSFGSEIKAPTGKVVLTSNSKLRFVACGTDLLPSKLVESDDFIIHPRAPTFNYVTPATTTTGNMNLSIIPLSSTEPQLGVAYVLVKSENDKPSCTGSLLSGEKKMIVKVYDVVQAVACCVGVVCADSEVATWGPVKVKAEKPTYSSACSTTKPQTLVMEFATATVDASIRYQILTTDAQSSLTCLSGTLYEKMVEVSAGAVKIVAVSCLSGLQMSDYTEIDVELDKCCSGLAAYSFPSCFHVLLLQDNFTTCPGDGTGANTNWNSITSQWGGANANGGVHSENVRCVQDATLGKQVLDLTVNGDLFTGDSPIGKIMSDGVLRDRTDDDKLTKWTLDGITELSCDQVDHCPVRRVGAAVTSVRKLNSGVMSLKIKPCTAFGTLTQIWWGDYPDADTSNTKAKLPFLQLWKAALSQTKTTPNIPFTLTSRSTQSEKYTEIVMQWDAKAARTNFYLDGQLVQKQMGTGGLPNAVNSLSIGVWIPNAAAGNPAFPTCHTYVDQVQVLDLEITAGKWCDYEEASIPCSKDADCEEWVQLNCFMDIFEAGCSYKRNDIDDGSISEQFCHFRLQPMVETSISSTVMTTRKLALHWEEED
ncbi:hypothetical protein P3T76_002429 [Phytophthora citrophthora]|uniref:GH16 domain-containing protein n=1 Tax=Phytophthora citrophthora TaxID=4793 RepID=A0AAD9GY45_9STRA|nr:hypothetical protein P3T76_002429 [Phytophthora citrophthora]